MHEFNARSEPWLEQHLNYIMLQSMQLKLVRTMCPVSKQSRVGCELRINAAMMPRNRGGNGGRSARHVITAENKIWTCPKWNASTCSFIHSLTQSISIPYALLLSCLSRPYEADLPLFIFVLFMHFIVHNIFWKRVMSVAVKINHIYLHCYCRIHWLQIHFEIARFFTYIDTHTTKYRTITFCFLFALHPLKGTEQSTKTNNQFMIE